MRTSLGATRLTVPQVVSLLVFIGYPAVAEIAREDAAALLAGTHAVEQLRAALAAYEGAGATADATRVRAALRARGVRVGVRGARQRPATGWDSLTPTERTVVALAAEGLTSRQIG